MEATAIVGTSQEAGSGNQTRYDERQRQESALKEYAKSERIWVKDFETKYGDILDVGGKARVNYDGNVVTKVNDLSFHDWKIHAN